MVAKAWGGVVAALLLCASNSFMTCAWYLHLKLKEWPMAKAIIISWGIAFFEYCLQVPANRTGHISQGGPFTAPQLKVIQEFISLVVFGVFSIYVLKEKLRWPDIGAFLLIFSGVLLSLSTKLPTAEPTSSDLMQPPHRGLLQLPHLQLKHLLPGAVARPHHEGLGAAAEYQRVETAGSDDWEGAAAAAAASVASASLPALGRAGDDLRGIGAQAAVHTQSELVEAGELHRRAEHIASDGRESEAVAVTAAAGNKM